ncbi:hypothetical protein [Streptococcus caballi]|uniref:hypothetical protein n=1 Tax=Streptococcus caballi TaxID=439220 RepID=UPI00036C3135|nr:hypothetical protein [Streptococcus caballi]
MVEEKEQLITGFEECYWKIDSRVRQMLLDLPLDSLIIKLVEWQNWAECGGKVVF